MKKTGLRVLNLLEHDVLRLSRFILEVIFYSVCLVAVITSLWFFVWGLQPVGVAGVQRPKTNLD